jgi:hypothetical protein
MPEDPLFELCEGLNQLMPHNVLVTMVNGKAVTTRKISDHKITGPASFNARGDVLTVDMMSGVIFTPIRGGPGVNVVAVDVIYAYDTVIEVTGYYYQPIGSMPSITSQTIVQKKRKGENSGFTAGGRNYDGRFLTQMKVRQIE